MIGIPEASAAIGGIKAAFGMAQGMVALKSEADINLAIINIQRTLLDAQNAALADKELIGELRQRINELEKQIADRSAWEAEKRRYALTETTLGAFTYDLRPEMANDEVHHRLCVTCFNDGRKSVLHTIANHSGGEMVRCGVCKSDLTLAKFIHKTRPTRRPNPYL
jgi:hypothetical protein